MALFRKMPRMLFVLGIIGIYCTVVWLGLTERNRRSLSIVEASAKTSDFVVINATVTAVDTAQGLIHERIRLIPKGRFAIDRATPATDLKLLINSASGKQSVVFSKGDRIFPVEFTSLLVGDRNRYPFHSYVTEIDVLVTAASKKKAEVVPEQPLQNDSDPLSITLEVGRNDLNDSETIPINENVTASIPGIRFLGDVTLDDRYKITRTTISVRRAYNAIAMSVIVMSVMVILSISNLATVLRVISTPGEINLIPLSLCVALIFGLPALRSVQPGVPARLEYWGTISLSSGRNLSYLSRRLHLLGYGLLDPRDYAE